MYSRVSIVANLAYMRLMIVVFMVVYLLRRHSDDS